MADGKQPISRKFLIVERPDGSGNYNLMMEVGNKTKIAQVPRATAERIINRCVDVTLEVLQDGGGLGNKPRVS